MPGHSPDQDTETFDGPAAFPATPWSAILHAGGHAAPARREALSRLLSLYCRPIYVYIRRKWNKSNEDAKDLTQAFVASALQKDLMGGADPSRGRFHALMRTSIDNFVRNQYVETQARRRGGGRRIVSLESDPDAARATAGAGAEDAYHREWQRAILTRAHGILRDQYAAGGKAVYWTVFEKYRLSGEGAPATYDAIARELGLKIWDVTNYLADAKRRLVDIVASIVREYALTDEEFRDEMRELRR